MLLKFLRKRENMKRIMWMIAILIVPAFVIWGIGTTQKQTRTANYAGKIFDTKVSFDEYKKAYQSAMDFVRNSYGTNVPYELIHDIAWNRLILLEEAKHQNIKVSDEEVVEKITQMPIFQRNGDFDRALYKSMLQDGARNFEENIREDLIISKLKNKVVSDVVVTEDELKEEYKKENENIKASYILIRPKEFENKLSFTDEELKTYYEKNKENFKTEEKVNVEYIGSKYGDEEEKEQAEEKIFKLAEGLRGKNFEDFAKKNSLEIKQTGLFSINEPVPNIGFSYEFTKQSFSLKPGQISEPIETDKGYYILRVKEKRLPQISLFEEVKDRVKQSLLIEKSWEGAKEKANELYSKIKQALNEGKTFQDITSQLGLEIKITEPITRNSYIPGIGPGEEFTNIGFGLKIGEIGAPIKVSAGYCIIRLDEFQTVEEKFFQEEKESFREKLLLIKKDVAFERYFEELKRRANLISNLRPQP